MKSIQGQTFRKILQTTVKVTWYPIFHLPLFFQYSVARVTISVNTTSVSFYFGKQIEPEKFHIGYEAVTLKPKGEPEAEISIPKGSFESEGQMSLQVTILPTISNSTTEF